MIKRAVGLVAVAAEVAVLTFGSACSPSPTGATPIETSVPASKPEPKKLPRTRMSKAVVFAAPALEPEENDPGGNYQGPLPVGDGVTLQFGNWSGGREIRLRARRYGVPMGASCPIELDPILPRSVRDEDGTIFGCPLAMGFEGEAWRDEDGDGVDETKDCFVDQVYRCSDSIEE